MSKYSVENKMVKASLDTLMPVYEKLFNSYVWLCMAM